MISLGRHIIAELYNCNLEKIDDVIYVEESMLTAAEKSGATVINSTFHHFSPYGVSGVIVIQESHFSIHCWPEYGYASIDIYTCGDTVDPWVAYESLKSDLEASHGSTMELNRGQSNLINSEANERDKARDGILKRKPEIKFTKNVWFTERNDNIALSLKHFGNRLFYKRSAFQKIEIYQTEALGKILVLDGRIACAEEDEYVYHEMIAHVPVFAHGNAKKVLVIGGGDGGTVRELIKHNIACIDLVEIDKEVIEASRSFLPELATSIDNENVSVKIDDGVAFVSKSNSKIYDIVIVDSDDPNGPSEGLFAEDFYVNVNRILKDNGILVTQSESPRFNVNVFKDVYRCFRNIFGAPNVHCYLMYLPSFPSGMWSFSLSHKSDKNPVSNLNDSEINQFCIENKLKYYSFDIHKSAFIIPEFVKELLQ